MTLTFQQVILKLQQFWSDRGCVLWQPYYTQVGAGTMNPATFLHVLGPEPWNVAYVEPSVRPDDGRYGENPNRFQLHYQYQVILKPDPGNPQELYLDSLKAIGINPRQHDIRFVEDNWAQPAISAWGLGWEVWLDGQEITQFTYFQQVGGITLDPVAVEITYGLERILIGLHNVKAAWDLPWSDTITYGEVRKQEEREHSKYYFEVADVARMAEVFDRFEREAVACLDQGLLLPAHDYVLKCSHIFNTLDARGAIGVTERQAYFRRMRELARRVAEGYLEQRKALEYPLLRVATTGSDQKPSQITANGSLPLNIDSRQQFVFEIGTEELPAGDMDTAIAQLRERVPLLLNELSLEHGDVRVYATPRRLVVSVADLSPHQPDRENVIKGPPADKAFDKDGKPTQAALGFARKNGLVPSALTVREEGGGKYVFAIVSQKSRSTPDVFAETLPGLVAGIKFEKSMKWDDSGVVFSRPIRWLLALFGDQVIPFDYAGIVSGRITRGLRPHDSPEINIPSADKYFSLIKNAGIILGTEERKQLIVEQVNKAASTIKGQIILDDELLAEVANLIETPTAVLGAFDKGYLSLPRDVLISVMKKHQRYFPITDPRSSELLPNFIAIRNGDDEYLDVVRDGNEHVLGARFADADFFVRADLKHKLEDFRLKLGALIFQTKLGSMLDKAERILKLAKEILPMVGLSKLEQDNVARAAYLAKADLTTQMVTEMTSLQGIIGREYALRSGEKPEVAEAIGDQYQPVPKTKIGVVVALADRIDSLVGLFAAGLAPTGAKDPFALRRAAIGVVQPLIEHEISFDLRTAIKKSASLQPIDVSEDVQTQVLSFIRGRLSVVLKDSGYKYDVVDAVLEEQSDDPARAAAAVKELQAWVKRADWSTILPAFARCVRITRDQKKQFKVNEKGFVEKEEKELYKALQQAEIALVDTAHGTSAGLKRTPDAFFKAFVPMIPAVNSFFDKVLVITDEKYLRENRLGLLQRISAMSDGVVNLSKLEGF
jgi:glycyl-tRNA synthetase